MPFRLALLGLLVTLAIPATRAQDGGILVIRPITSLSVDLGLGTRPTTGAPVEPSGTAAGPRGRGAVRGAKIGALVGLGIGAVVTALAFSADASNSCSGDGSLCAGPLAVLAIVPFTLATTGIGAGIGAATARP